MLCNNVIIFFVAALEVDIQLSDNVLIFMNGTSELQQCIDLLVVDDNLIEIEDFFLLTATATSGSTSSELIIIIDTDSEY